MSATEAKGRFYWFDLMAKDPQGAIDFYTQVVGWSTGKWDGPGGNPDYTMWMLGEEGVGGVMTLPKEAAEMGAPQHWMGFVVVPDVDATAAAFTEAGGQVFMPPMDMPGVGRIGGAFDPWGAGIGLYCPEGDVDGEVPAPTPGRVSWCELMSAGGHEAALAFYGKVFGWEASDQMDMGEEMGGIYQMYRKPGMQWSLGGMMNKPDNMPVSAWLYYFLVEDLDSALNRVRELGGQVVNGPMEVPDGDRVAQCMDPQGGMFALHARKSG